METKTVLQVLEDRQTYRNLGMQKQDNYVLALGVDGGAMRGAISLGMLLALKDLKMLDLFDYYVGMSAGSFNLAYVLAGQGARGLDLYLHEMTKKDNLNLKRLINPDSSIMDLRRMYVHVVEEDSIDLAKLRQDYGSTFYVSVANVTDGIGELYTPNQAGDRFMEYLVAGATLPLIAGDPWKIDNKDYYDGGIFYIKVEKAAQALGCTHVLTLNTQYEGYVLKPFRKPVQQVIKTLDDNYNNMGSKYLRVMSDYCEAFENIPYGEAMIDSMHMYRHVLSRRSAIRRLTTDKQVILDGVKDSYKSVLNLFEVDQNVGYVPTMV